MTNNPNELTIENSVLVLIDHQPAVAINVRSIDLGLLVNNVAALSQVAKAFGVPTVLTTVGAQGSALVDPSSRRSPRPSPTTRQSTAPRRTRGHIRTFGLPWRQRAARSW